MRKLVIAALIAVPVGGGWYAVDYWRDARYERRCVNSADDIPECLGGYAGWARKRCDAQWYPPEYEKLPGHFTEECVKAWLAHGK